MSYLKYTTDRMMRPHRAFTLVELMVALTIALVLTAVALPRVKEGLKQNVSTRTATLVKSTFENARAQAIRTGRPFGVRIHRATSEVTDSGAGTDAILRLNDPLVTASQGANYCNRLSFVQIAFEYRGDVRGARAMFSLAGPAPSVIMPRNEVGLLEAITRGYIRPQDQPVAPGSLVTLGQVEQTFEVTVPPGRSAAIESYTPFAGEQPDFDGNNLVDPPGDLLRVWLNYRSPFVSSEARFQTGDTFNRFRFRTRPIASPMADVELPGKFVIDLTASGVGSSVIAFSPRSISDDPSSGAAATATVDPPYKQGTTSKLAYRDVIVMFNGSGQLDSVYLDRYIPDSGPDNSTESDDYAYVRIPIASPINLLVGDVRNVVRPESMVIYPNRPPGISTADVPASYGVPSNVRPNFANTDNSWLTISPLSGRVKLSSVARPFELPAGASLPASQFGARHPEIVTPTVSNVLRAKLTDSSRLARESIQ